MDKVSVDEKTEELKKQILRASPIEACRLMDSGMRGLTQEEAEKRLSQYGKNEIAQKKKTSMTKMTVIVGRVSFPTITGVAKKA